MTDKPGDVTQLLFRLRIGDREAESKLVDAVYGELHRLAAAYMRRERLDHTLQPTALLHEAYVRLVNQREKDWQNRAHFFGVAAQVMRRILVDHARVKRTEKRGGTARKVDFDEAHSISMERSEELLAIDEALSRLAEIDPRQAHIVELRFFGGLTEEETAQVLGISSRTVKRDWTVAKAWLRVELKSGELKK
jgi:RNA polymerase sigma factor (TIGR02999 family)